MEETDGTLELPIVSLPPFLASFGSERRSLERGPGVGLVVLVLPVYRSYLQVDVELSSVGIGACSDRTTTSLRSRSAMTEIVVSGWIGRGEIDLSLTALTLSRYRATRELAT